MPERNDPFHSIEHIPAADLLKLSCEELDGLIAQAREARDHASRVIGWLQAIKLEKAVRESANKTNPGGGS